MPTTLEFMLLYLHVDFCASLLDFDVSLLLLELQGMHAVVSLSLRWMLLFLRSQLGLLSNSLAPLKLLDLAPNLLGGEYK